MKPNFIIIGAAKCGTTSLWYNLRQHPQIFMPENKELRFFSHDNFYRKGYSWYESFFEAAKSKKAIGEASPSYSQKERYPDTVSRMFEYIPRARLIYIVRDPLKFIESHWIQLRRNGDPVHYNFQKAIMLNKSWLLPPCNYWEQINAYRKYFTDEQILVLFYKDYKNNQDSVLRRCFNFLKVDSEIIIDNAAKPINVSRGKEVDQPFLYTMRRWYFYRRNKQVIPQVWREKIKGSIFRKPIYCRPKWDERSINFVKEYLEKDTRKFLKFYGKNEDFWKFKLD